MSSDDLYDFDDLLDIVSDDWGDDDGWWDADSPNHDYGGNEDFVEPPTVYHRSGKVMDVVDFMEMIRSRR